jgi:hypothetical protein
MEYELGRKRSYGGKEKKLGTQLEGQPILGSDSNPEFPTVPL